MVRIDNYTHTSTTDMGARVRPWARPIFKLVLPTEPNGETPKKPRRGHHIVMVQRICVDLAGPKTEHVDFPFVFVFVYFGALDLIAFCIEPCCNFPAVKENFIRERDKIHSFWVKLWPSDCVV